MSAADLVLLFVVAGLVVVPAVALLVLVVGIAGERESRERQSAEGRRCEP